MFLSISVDEWCNIKAKQSSWASKMISGEAEVGTIYWQIREATSHPYHCTISQVEDKDLCTSPSCEKHKERDTLLPCFPWGVEENLTEGLTWLLMQPLEHSSNKSMMVNQRQSPTTSWAWPAPLALAAILAILVMMRWKIKAMLSLHTPPPPPPPLFSSHSCIKDMGDDWSGIFKRSLWVLHLLEQILLLWVKPWLSAEIFG